MHNNIHNSIINNHHDFHWGYDEDNGPKTWPSHYNAAGGARQSPINIDTNKVRFDPTLGNDLSWTASRFSSTKITNNGHGFIVELDTDAVLQGGPLGKDRYRFWQFHFHWGPNNQSGSEHTIDGRSFAGEVHFVHKNEKYADINEALKMPDGLAVIGYFITVGSKRQPEYDQFLSLLPDLKFFGDKMENLPGFNLGRLLAPYVRQLKEFGYYTYPGSLTTPPCNECVTWIVMRQSIAFSEDQFKQLRNVCFSKREEPEVPILRNYRPPCQIGARVVRSSIPLSPYT